MTVVHFKQGDVVPRWIMSADKPEWQHSAYFLSDATVEFEGEIGKPVGGVTVTIEASHVGGIHLGGHGVTWSGAPTRLVGEKP